MRILVTGAAGFIGSHLCERLLWESGCTLVGVDDFRGAGKPNLETALASGRFSLVEGDCRNGCGIASSADIDEIYHFAAYKRVDEGEKKQEEYWENNVNATKSMLELARKKDVGKFVFASTSAVYGNAPQLPTPESCPLAPISTYGSTKAQAEMLCREYCREQGMKSVILRYANVYGERSLDGLAHDVVMKIQENKSKLSMRGDGTQKKSYMYVKDAVEATVLASAKAQKKCEAFNIGTDDSYSVREIVGKICAMLDAKPKVTYEKQREGWKGDVVDMRLSIEKIRRLGFRQEYGIDEGLQRYARWLQKAKK